MKCENSFCIYQSKDVCTIETISINSVGMCVECIYPNIDEHILQKAKAVILKQYEDGLHTETAE